MEKERIAREAASDENLEGTTTNIVKQPIDQPIEKQEEQKTTTTYATEEEFIEDKVKNAHVFDEDECVVCMKHFGSFEA